MMQRLAAMTRGVPYEPFKDVPEAARPHLKKALDCEVRAGWAVRDGKLKTAEQFRVEARESWRAARALGL